jgi:hypothetical protein
MKTWEILLIASGVAMSGVFLGLGAIRLADRQMSTSTTTAAATTPPPAADTGFTHYNVEMYQTWLEQDARKTFEENHTEYPNSDLKMEPHAHLMIVSLWKMTGYLDKTFTSKSHPSQNEKYRQSCIITGSASADDDKITCEEGISIESK